jgi:FK506-binding protein 14
MIYNIFALIALFASSTQAVTVTQTDGPTDCAVKTAAGMHLSMHYTGTIDVSSATGVPGKQFDSSIPRGQTFDFPLGAGRVIKGWDEGLVGLCKGAKATLIIPPEEGYGDRGAGGDIPGGATLRFDVEVVDFGGDAPAEPNLFKQLDTSGDKRLSQDEVLAFFKQQGKNELPAGLWESEDKDGDGFLSWDEFSGPKGTKEEL